MKKIFRTNPEVLIGIVIAGVIIYIALVFLLRISGKRTLSKWNAFDLVVTIALGSSFSSALLTQNISIPEAIVALALLIMLQFLVTWLSVRSPRLQKLVKSKPSIIFCHGRFLERQMKKKRVTASEIKAAIRSQGYCSLSSILAVVLETDGTFSIVKQNNTAPDYSALANAEGFDEYIAKNQAD